MRLGCGREAPTHSSVSSAWPRSLRHKPGWQSLTRCQTPVHARTYPPVRLGWPELLLFTLTELDVTCNIFEFHQLHTIPPTEFACTLTSSKPYESTSKFQNIAKMAPRGTKRKSDETIPDNVEDAHDVAPQTIATKAGSPSRSSGQDSPRKKQRTGISLSQKQALIDNLQLESMWPQLTKNL